MRRWQIYKLENALDCSGGIRGAVAAAVAPAVNTAMRPLADQVNAIAATVQNIQIMLRNSGLSQAKTNPPIPFTPPVKAIAGHPGFQPTDQAFHNVVVGARLPVGMAFPAGGIWTTTSIMQLTDNEISDLQWFYNEPLGAGQSIARRREAVHAIFIS